jgi:hypothetical protein
MGIAPTSVKRFVCAAISVVMTLPPEQQHDRATNPTLRHGLVALAIRYNFDCVRMNRLPRAIAGVAIVISSSEFLPSNLNSGARLDDVGDTVLAEREELTVVCPGRGSKSAAR